MAELLEGILLKFVKPNWHIEHQGEVHSFPELADAVNFGLSLATKEPTQTEEK